MSDAPDISILICEAAPPPPDLACLLPICKGVRGVPGPRAALRPLGPLGAGLHVNFMDDARPWLLSAPVQDRHSHTCPLPGAVGRARPLALGPAAVCVLEDLAGP